MSKPFDRTKYTGDKDGFQFVDGSDVLGNRGFKISFYHVPSETFVNFKAFITSFNETYSSNFTPHEAFGRTDPIYQFKNTNRSITLAFNLPAGSENEAYENLGRVSKLEQMLYPNYVEGESATTITQAPLIRLKVMNLLTNNLNPSTEGVRTAQEIYNSYSSTDDPADGILGVITSCTVDHNLAGEDGVMFKQNNTILPKLLSVNVSFNVIHEKTIGWHKPEGSEDVFALDKYFPYGATTTTDARRKLTENFKPQIPRTQAATILNQRRQVEQNVKARNQQMLDQLGMRSPSEIVENARAQTISDALGSGPNLGVETDLGFNIGTLIGGD